VRSAGLRPADTVHPLAVEVMSETRIDIAGQAPKSFDGVDPSEVDIVITLCDQDVCPERLKGAAQLRWSVRDPQKVQPRGDPEAFKRALVDIREVLRKKLLEHEARLTWIGPASYLNWHARLDNRPCSGTAEVPFYSDVFHLRGEPAEDLGPYRLQLAFPRDQHDPALVLTIDDHLSHGDMLRMTKTNIDGFTGSSLADEVAALLSLEMGVRVMAGSVTRYSMGERWIVRGDDDRPVFFPVRGERVPVLPRVAARKEVVASLLSQFPKLPADAATALIRAARSYRDAIWIAESEPELSWLMLVSAIEVAAVQQQIQNSPADVLREAKPDLVDALDERSFAAVANAFERELAATKRFTDLLLRFLPTPPEQRPPEGFQIDWSAPALEKRFKKVYKLRSDALHEAVPIPPPMCSPPDLVARDQPWTETVVGLAASTLGGVWMKDDLPFSLHMFEYIARGALLGWWRALINASAQ
jgi:hypothetical protein